MRAHMRATAHPNLLCCTAVLRPLLPVSPHPAEGELSLWLEAVARGGTYEQLADALACAGGELNALRTTTVTAVQQFFRHAAPPLCTHISLVFVIMHACTQSAAAELPHVPAGESAAATADAAQGNCC